MKSTNTIQVALLILVSGCSQGPTKNAFAEYQEGHETTHSPHELSESVVQLNSEQAKLARIEVEPVQTRQIQASLDVTGTVNSTTRGRAVVTPPVAGRIVSITVALGDKVQMGQSLAVLESVDLAQSWSSIASAERIRDAAMATVREAQSEVKLSLSKLVASKSNLSRQSEMAKVGAFSQAPLQLAQSDLNDAQSELLSLQKEQASHAELVRRLDNLYRDGIVSKAELEAARLELQQDQIKLDRAGARIANAKATYDREKTIAARGLLNAKELQTAEAEVASAKLELDRARIRVQSAEAAVQNAIREISNAKSVYRFSNAGNKSSVGRVVLAAPISGTLTHIDVTKGQAVERTQVLMEVEDLTTVWVTANVPEQDASRVVKGQTVRITVKALKGQDFHGIVQNVGNRLDPKTRTVPIQCLVSEVNGILKPEMFATVQVRVGPKKQALVVSNTALIEERDKSFVFVKSGTGFIKTAVSLGTRMGGLVEIVSGLRAGDSVVVKGVFVLFSELKKDVLKGHEH